MSDRAPTHLPSAVIPGMSDLVRATGELLFVAGQTGMAPDGSVPETFEAEVDAAWAALASVLERAGASTADIVKLTIYVTDLPSRSLQVMRDARDRWVDLAAPPASALIGVADLFHPAVRFEVEAIAVVGAGR